MNLGANSSENYLVVPSSLELLNDAIEIECVHEGSGEGPVTVVQAEPHHPHTSDARICESQDIVSVAESPTREWQQQSESTEAYYEQTQESSGEYVKAVDTPQEGFTSHTAEKGTEGYSRRH